MTKDEALKLALEALEASHFLIHGSETKGGLAFCMDGYYSGCFDIDSNDKQTNEALTAIKEALAQPEQEPVAWVYPEGLEALKAGKPWTAYGTRQEPNNTALYLSPQPDIAPYAWVTFTPYGDEDDVWYENPEGQLPEGWTYKPLYDTTPPQRKPLTENEIKHLWYEACQTNLELTSQLIVHLARNIEAAHGIKGEA